MARIVKTRKRKISFKTFTFLYVFLATIAHLLTSVFLRSYNNSLSLQKQSILAQINSIEVENEAISVVIQNLSTRDRIVAIANENGLTLDQSNIITITNGD